MKTPMIRIIERARRYIAKMPEAISGQHGHSTMFRVACVLMQGFALSMADARMLLEEYNATLTEPFTPKEIEHKLKDAAHAKPLQGRGYLLNPVDQPIQVRVMPKQPADTPPRVIHQNVLGTGGTGKSYSARENKPVHLQEKPVEEPKTPVPPVPDTDVDVTDLTYEIAKRFARGLSGRVCPPEERML